MKRIVAFLAALLALLPFAPAFGSDADTTSSGPSATPTITVPLPFEVPGFVIETGVFFAMEDAFFQADFVGDMKTIALNDAQTLVFNPAGDAARLFPNFYVMAADAEPFGADADAASAIMGSLIATMQYLQEQFPDQFLINNEIITAHGGSLSYMVSEPEIWLWPDSMSAVLLPVCFYENENRALVDGICLLEVASTAEGALRYALYNDPRHVTDYMAHVTVSSENGPFQAVLALWYIQNFSQTTAEGAGDQDTVIGMARISSLTRYVRASDDKAAKVIATARNGEEFPVFAVTENGWYLIRYSSGEQGYIISDGVEYHPSE